MQQPNTDMQENYTDAPAHGNVSPFPSRAYTERQIHKYAKYFVIALVAGFAVTHVIKMIDEHRLEKMAEAEASAPPLVEAITVAKAPSTLAFTLPGETAAWYESTIYARVNGYVASWNADIGDQVKKGQVLATIETPELDAQLVSAQALISSRQAAVEFAKTTYDRWRNSPKGVVSEQEREAKKAAYTSALAQLNQAKADVDRYMALAKFKEVKAPYDGKIIKRNIDIGNLVTAGSTDSTTPLYEIAQNDPMRVFVDVPQSAAQDIKNGVAAHITAGSLQGQVFDGKVARTAEAIDPQARTLKVEVDLPNPKQALVPGMYVDVAFDVPQQGMVEVPASALVFRAHGPEVAVIGKDGKVAFRSVAIARDNGSTLEIASGIAPGDQVALNISNQVMEGEAVKVSEYHEGVQDADKAKE
ncbi:MAG TPA: efflux RND transporter periplasmic adaptor subunit [Rickettsiales bacterium]|nr:efflux RND transporter periplasmic adaptor subunit [Rickettsiales bacterium]